MQILEFTTDEEVRKLVSTLKSEGITERPFSDCKDQLGRQYVDLVLEGGGVLGVALVGYTWLLEQMGIRFASVAGTSAGAINAMLLMAHKPVESELASEWVLERIANTQFYDFLDGSAHARKLVSKIVRKEGWPSIAFSLVRIRKTLHRSLGLHPGNAFQKWMKIALDEVGINSTADLIERCYQKARNVYCLTSKATKVDTNPFKIKLITAELSTQSKIQLPKMANLFWENPLDISPALHVRASMSIPLFFEPLKIDLAHWNAQKWAHFTGYRGPAFKTATLVDGGLVSNFPIHLFHTDSVPTRPSFGVKLNNSRAVAQPVNTLGDLGLQSFSTARHLFDYDFLYKNPDYRQLIGFIDTGEHHWLNFDMSKSDKIDLFRRGVKAAAQFLRRFDWQAYKISRGESQSPGK